MALRLHKYEKWKIIYTQLFGGCKKVPKNSIYLNIFFCNIVHSFTVFTSDQFNAPLLNKVILCK